MKKLSTIFLLLILIGCSKSEFNIDERNEDINSIIETIIETDSINVLKNNVHNNKIEQFLSKVKIVTTKPDEEIGPLERNERRLDWILKLGSQSLLNKNDSIYLLSQNISPDSLEIDNVLKEKYNYSKFSNISKDRKKGIYYKYYEFSIPIFSKGNNMAYVEMNYHSESYFGKGIVYILKKENNKWKVISKRGTWIS